MNFEFNKNLEQVGGSTGHASFALATAYPDLHFIVQDMPSVLNQNPHPGHTHYNSSLGDRLIFQPYDFFNRQPVRSADVYLLRMILHDWPYSSAIKILQNIVPALAEHSRILIMDTILPAPGEVTPYKEALLRVRDMTMLQVFNAGERGMEDWEEVVKGADARLRIVGVKQPLGSAMGLIEVTLDAWEQPGII
jgi:6-hydroxytryprostatin B O-methyltransferase